MQVDMTGKYIMWELALSIFIQTEARQGQGKKKKK